MSEIATTDGTNGSNTDDSKMQKFELYIKASAIDRETKGSCPICQQFFMITCVLGENQDDVDFKVFTVQAECPPKNFAVCWSKKYPVVMVNNGHNKTGQDISGMMYDTFEDLETFFEGINKECPELKRKNAPNQAAMAVVENVYKHFNHFIAGQTDRGLVSQLKKLNEYLESQDTRFLVDNVLSFSDCHLLPRLQHIRVAGKYYRGFDIPKEFKYIWRYLQYAYMQDAFKSTIPSDQDIIYHYEKKVPSQYKTTSINTKLVKFTYTLEVPEECRQNLEKGSQEQVLDDEDYTPIPPSPSTEGTTTTEGTAHQNSHDNDAVSCPTVPDPTHTDDQSQPDPVVTEIMSLGDDKTGTNGIADSAVDQVTDQVESVEITPSD